MAEDNEIPQGQAAYRRLLEDIRDGGLAPGMRLRETELAERLGISRTPVREAIRQLEADGLVVHLPRQALRSARWTMRKWSSFMKCGRCWKARLHGWPHARLPASSWRNSPPSTTSWRQRLLARRPAS
ncbi:GntR family transcriptional regulator [Pannonibacter sp. Pt2-lr]